MMKRHWLMVLILICSNLGYGDYSIKSRSPFPPKFAILAAGWTQANFRKSVTECIANLTPTEGRRAVAYCNCVLSGASEKLPYVDYIRDPMDAKTEAVLEAVDAQCAWKLAGNVNQAQDGLAHARTEQREQTTSSHLR